MTLLGKKLLNKGRFYFLNNAFRKKFFRYHSSQKNLPAVEEINKDTLETKDALDEYNPKDYALLLYKQRKIPKSDRAPFAREFFLGKVDTDMLAFPEVLERNEVDNLEKYAAHIKKVLSVVKDDNILAQKDVMNHLQQLGIYGLTIPHEYGGLGATMTEYARLAEEFGMDSGFASILNSHLLMSAQYIIENGSPEQKAYFLPKMATGEHLASFCFREPNIGSDLLQLKTLASRSLDGETIVVNGEKCWVPNGQGANVFFTLATKSSQTPDPTATSVYIVGKDDHVHVTPMDNISALSEAPFCHVKFEKPTIPSIALINSFEGGIRDTHHLFAYNRFGIAATTLGKLKKLFRMCLDYTTNTKRFDKYLNKYEGVLVRMSEMHHHIYMLESVVYMNAALMDTGMDNDIENALLMTLCRQISLKVITTARQLLGVEALRDNHPCQRYFKDLQTLYYMEVPDTLLKVYAAMSGAIHLSSSYASRIRRARNPLLYPVEQVRYAIEEYKKTKSMKTQLDLAGYVHPSLMPQADEWDRMVVKFHFTALRVFYKHSRNMLDHESDLERLSDAFMYIYAILACLSRSSRSYCIGLHNAQHEINAARILSFTYQSVVEALLNSCEESDTTKAEFVKMKEATRFLEIKDYPHEKPFNYND